MTHDPRGDAEWQIIELVCRGTDEATARLRDLMLRREFRAGDLLERALRHRVLPLLVHAIESADLWECFPASFGPQLRLLKAANARRNRVLTGEAQVAAHALEAAGVPVACTKGAVFQYTLYDGAGTRVVSDIDLMIRPADVATTQQVMTDLGYTNGVYERRTHTIGSLPSKTRMLYRLSPDHLPHFIRLRDDEETPFSLIDFAYSLTWHGSQWQVPMDEVLAERGRLTVPAGGGSPALDLPTLREPYSFLFAVLHLFREAWFERTARVRDVTYGGLTDVYRAWQRSGDDIAAPLRDVIDRHGLHDPVRWVAAHTDTVFGTSIAATLGLAADPDDPWLRSARSLQGQQVQWTGSIHDRLWAGTPPEFAAAG